MPFPPSTTTVSGRAVRTASASMKRSAAAWNSPYRSTSCSVPRGAPLAVGAAGRPPGASSRSIVSRMSWMPLSPDSAIAPSRTSFAPV